MLMQPRRSDFGIGVLYFLFYPTISLKIYESVMPNRACPKIVRFGKPATLPKAQQMKAFSGIATAASLLGGPGAAQAADMIATFRPGH